MASARRHATVTPSTRPSESVRVSRESLGTAERLGAARTRACDHPRHPELEARRVDAPGPHCNAQAMEVDEATQATEENVQRHVNALTGAHLEAVIDTLEVLTGPWPGIVAKGQQAADALKSNEPTWRGGVGSKLVLKEPQLAAVLGPVIHAYWLQKRQKLGKPLLRRFWPATSPTDSNPHCVFRPREKERYKLRKHRKNLSLIHI